MLELLFQDELTVREGRTVYYRSIFDLVRDLAANEGGPEKSRLLARYLKPDLLIIDDMGLKDLDERSFRSIRQADIELRALNVLIGANGAGQSNLLDFFRMLNYTLVCWAQI